MEAPTTLERRKDVKMSNFPQTGDVIVSGKFAYGYREELEEKGPITIDGHTTHYPVSRFLSDEEKLKITLETKRLPPQQKIFDSAAYDESRGQAQFVVECGKFSVSVPGDDYPPGWHIIARRLNPDGSYNPEGEVIRFYLSGNFTCILNPDDVKIVGKMTRKVTFIWKE